MSLDKYKSKVLAKGFQKTKGINYTELLVLSSSQLLSLAQEWVVRILNVNTAFLNGDIREEVYMT